MLVVSGREGAGGEFKYEDSPNKFVITTPFTTAWRFL
jgi:hypothetical protein